MVSHTEYPQPPVKRAQAPFPVLVHRSCTPPLRAGRGCKKLRHAYLVPDVALPTGSAFEQGQDVSRLS